MANYLGATVSPPYESLFSGGSILPPFLSPSSPHFVTIPKIYTNGWIALDNCFLYKEEFSGIQRGVFWDTKRSFLEYDLANITELLPKYPGAVMIEYHSSSIETKSVCLALETFDKIEQWYLDKLNRVFLGMYNYAESIDNSVYILKHCLQYT